MPNCTISGVVLDPSGIALSGIEVDFNIQTPIIAAGPVQGTTHTAADGTWSMTLQQGLSGVFTVSTSPGNFGRTIPHRFNVNVPKTSSATFSSIVVDY